MEKKKSTPLAVLLSAIVPGLGLMYLGRVWRGVVMLGLFILGILAWLACIFLTPLFPILGFGIALAGLFVTLDWIYNVWDTYTHAVVRISRLVWALANAIMWVYIIAVLILFFVAIDLDFGFMRDRFSFLVGFGDVGYLPDRPDSVDQMIWQLAIPRSGDPSDPFIFFEIGFWYVGLPFAGLSYTIVVAVVSIIFAVIIAFFGALGRLSKNPMANSISSFYVSFIRGTPQLVQVYLVYLALPQLGLVLSAVPSGIIALSVNYGAYMTETFRAGIQSIGAGQREAAYALGMTPSQTMFRIVLPQAIRIIIPPVGNDFIAMLKDSALVSIMGVWELTFRAQKMGRRYFRNLEMLIMAALLYWVITIILQTVQGRIEKYMARGERKVVV